MVRRDLAFALRMLARRRSFASATVLTLAVGIGMATAMFSVADGILLRPLPVHEPERLAVMFARDQAAQAEHLPVPLSAFRAFRDQSRTFEAVAALDYNGAVARTVRTGGATSNLNVAFVTGNLFRMLGVQPTLGRPLQAGDDAVDAAPVVTISRGLWEGRFGSEPGVLGQTIRLMGREATIVGVLPRGFDLPSNAEVWAPTFPFTSVAGADSSWVFVHMVGRLAPGATEGQSLSELNTFLARADAPLPPVLRGVSGVVRSLEQHLLGDIRPLVRALLGAVVLLLLITVVNVATLLLGRAVERSQEFAVRSSLGASAWRVRLQVVTEGLVLALIGGTIGVGIAAGLIEVFTALAPSELPRVDAVRLDRRVLLFTLAISLGAALLFSLAPTLRLTRASPAGRLRTGSRGGAGHGETGLAQRALVVAQVSLALVVLAGAGLVVKSLSNLNQLDWGVDQEEVLLAQFAVPESSASLDLAAYRARVDQLAEAIQALPEIVSAVPTLMPPFAGASGWDAPYFLEGQRAGEQTPRPVLNLEAAAPGYFRTLGIPLLRGRAIDARDRADGRQVVVVSRSVARLAWPGREPIGRRIRVGDEQSPWRTVVGVVGDTRYRELTRIRPTVYLPRTQFAANPVFLAIRTREEATGAVHRIRRAGDETWPGVTFSSIQLLSAYASQPLARPRFAAVLFTAFALVSLLLASIGLYGVMAASVLQRSREIGIRMAMGAERGSVMRSILGRGLALALVGLGLGATLALVLTRLLGSILYGVSPADPFILVAVALILVITCLLASYLPARRATRVDPVVVLRAE